MIEIERSQFTADALVWYTLAARSKKEHYA